MEIDGKGTGEPDPRLAHALQAGRSLHDEWIDFEAKVIHAEAPAVQRNEMRRAFYAGVQALMGMIQAPGLNEAKLEAWRRELNYFVRLVQRGQA